MPAEGVRSRPAWPLDLIIEAQICARKTQVERTECQLAPIAMDPLRRFEWAMIENISDKALTAEVLQDPLSWEEMRPHPKMDRFLERWTESHPPAVDEKHEADFYMFLGTDFLCCRPEEKLPRRQTWIYAVRAEDPAMPPELQTAAFHRVKKVAVREVPPTLVVTCSFTAIAQDYFQAKFTTLAGELMLSFECPRPCSADVLTMSACKAAANQGRLWSRNQEVCVLLEGETEPLGIEKVPELYWCWLEMI
jgi:hypothetical protein